MAYLVGFENTDRVRAIIAIDALPPRRAKLPESDPINRLAYFFGTAAKSPSAAARKAILSQMREAKLLITEKSLGDEPRDLTADELTELGRWIDALDRI